MSETVRAESAWPEPKQDRTHLGRLSPPTKASAHVERETVRSLADCSAPPLARPTD